MKHYDTSAREITARFDSVCAETGKLIHKGDKCIYYPIGKHVYSMDSKQAYEYRMMMADRALGYDY